MLIQKHLNTHNNKMLNISKKKEKDSSLKVKTMRWSIIFRLMIIPFHVMINSLTGKRLIITIIIMLFHHHQIE